MIQGPSWVVESNPAFLTEQRPTATTTTDSRLLVTKKLGSFGALKLAKAMLLLTFASNMHM